MFEVQTLLKAFWNMTLGSACFIDEAFFFFGKNQNFQSWNYFLQVLDYQDFHIIGYQSEDIVLYEMHGYYGD